MQKQITGGAIAFNIDTPLLDQFVLLALAIAATVAAVALIESL